MTQATPSATRDWAAIVFALLLPTLVTLAYFVLADGFPAHVQQATYAVAKTLQFLFPVCYVVFVQRESLALHIKNTAGVGLGLAFGVVTGAAILAIYHFALKQAPFFSAVADEVQDKITDMDLGSPAVFIAVGVFYSLVHSLLEEYYWRWFVFGQLTRHTRVGLAIVISSLGFMAHHILVIGTYFGFLAPVTWIFSACVAVGGAFWAWLYHRSGSLLGPWLSHMLIDAAIFTTGYHIASSLLGR